jgi:hypothetical protein
MRAEISEPISRPGVLSYILIIIMTLWVGCFAICFVPAVDALDGVFSAMGEASIPRFTRFVMDNWIPIGGLLLWGFWAQMALFIFLLFARTFLVRRLALIAFALNITGQLVLIAAFYAPILKLRSPF